MRISVVICAYTMERWDDMVAAVSSSRAQSRPPDEVVLVIDYNDALAERARESLPEVIVTANRFTKGLSGARNTGVTVSTGEVVAFLDDDAVAEPEWLEELCRPFEDPEVAGTGGWIVPAYDDRSEPRWFPRTFLWVLGCSYDGLPPDGAAIRNPIGASMAMRREVFDRVGGFSSSLGRIGKNALGCEETELCIRYGRASATQRFVLARRSVVRHRVPAGRLTTRYFLARCWAEGISKAAVASLQGADRSLAAERRHATRALPREALDALGSVRADPLTSLRRLALVAAGLGATVAGVARGTVALRRRPLPASRDQAAVLLGSREVHGRRPGHADDR